MSKERNPDMATSTAQVGFHQMQDAQRVKLLDGATHPDIKFTYDFQNFFHPFLGELIARLNQQGLTGVMDPKFLQAQRDEIFFTKWYAPQNNDLVEVDAHPKEIDVSLGGAYSVYNWELFFHIPLAIAVHLSKNQRFAEAQRWFHFIFDPTSNDTSVPAPQRYWKFLAFRQGLPDPVALLSDPQADKTDLLRGYDWITNHPFQPHGVARTRPIAYEYCLVMKYLDNLIAWGDHLFLQDTIESINEATQIYVLAANLLGPRPQQVPPVGTVRAKSFADLRAIPPPGLDPMGNALVDLESQFPFDLALPAAPNGSAGDPSGPLFGIGQTLYFCIPRNDRLLANWDIAADRLWKIRHCMNVEGVVQQLPLFDAPLDPGMLVKAAAAGIDVGTIVAGLNQPLGPVRSSLLIQKAAELCAEVKSLGGALLAALEKGDAEHLARLRQGHEIQLQQKTREVRFLQWQQAQQATETLLRGRKSALERYTFYQRLLGLTPDAAVAPETFPLDRRELKEDNFDEAFKELVGQYDTVVPAPDYSQLNLPGGASPANQSGASGAGQLFLNANEDAELNTHLPTARDTRLAASVADTIAAVLTFIPEFNINLHFWGCGASSKVFGGSKLSDAVRIGADVLRTVSAWEQDQAGMASRKASYERRADEWTLQCKLAAHELMQIGRQVLSSLIAEQVAYHEHQNVKDQITQSQDVDAFLHDKFTSEELYGWMQGEISRLYYQYYRFAFDTARRAERTMKQELMRPELDATNFVQFNYWDGGRKGLLSGEALYLDVKRMEMAYHDNNRRELELTRHVSLRQLDPLALLNLKVTGGCEVTIPEWLFDLDCPGHYLRRLKSVALSIPSVVGPYTSLNGTLSLLKSTVRKSPALKGGQYQRSGDGDDRFLDYFGSPQSIVTSGGTNDSGLFEVNLRDERFLPFEGAGASSTWRLDLPTDFRPFDYSSISDVIIHLRYTARQGGDALGAAALADLHTMVKNAKSLALFFSLRHDFPTEWAAFVNGTGSFTASLRKDLFPYMAQGKTLTVDALDLYAAVNGALSQLTVAKANLNGDLNAPGGSLVLSQAPDPSVPVLTRTAADVYMVLRYSLG
jgi:hypothetical protein